METEQLIKALSKTVVPLAVFRDIDKIKEVGDYLRARGIPSVEVAYRTKSAGAAIRALKEQGGLIVGAGTVTDVATARDAIANGADFIVLPGLCEEVVRYCKETKIPVVPGIETATEILSALRLGLRFLKFFPAEAAGGVAKLQALHGPFPEVCFMPTGGIHENNAQSYFTLDYVVCCGSSSAIPKNLL